MHRVESEEVPWCVFGGLEFVHDFFGVFQSLLKP